MRGTWLLVLGGCLGPPPREPTVPTVPPPPPTPSMRVLVGADTDVTVSWNEGCDTKSSLTWESGEDAHKGLGIGTIGRKQTTVGCRPQRFYVEAKCDLLCEQVDSDDLIYTGSASVRMRVLASGLATVTLELIHADTHDHKTKIQTIEVLPPDSFRMQCMNPSNAWGPCERGLSAEQPLIRVWAILGIMIKQSTLLRVNGAAAPKGTSFTVGASLATILGQDPLAPGTYDLTVSVGAAQQQFSVVVQ
ncbi:MAG: hypothetical protein M3680_34400 [Myxococcota bacterium]|nr:hypothetical protein [Myxococcota bacterium]